MNDEIGQCFPNGFLRNPKILRSESKGSARKYHYGKRYRCPSA
jgi:hypothetical protein